MEEKSVWLLISDMLCGEASAQDLEKLQQLIECNESLRLYINVVKEFWNSPTVYARCEAEQHFEKVAERLAKKDAAFFEYNVNKVN
ncbi:MAG: hypothetical protein QM802_23670 [Agriterribacter sp.]